MLSVTVPVKVSVGGGGGSISDLSVRHLIAEQATSTLMSKQKSNADGACGGRWRAGAYNVDGEGEEVQVGPVETTSTRSLHSSKTS